MKKVLNKKGISLIVLVITIVIMIILAGAVILTLVNSGIIGQTQIGLFKNNVANYKAELATYISDALVRGTINVCGEDIEFKPEEFSRDKNLIQEYITSMSDTDSERFFIVQGQLAYIADDSLFTAEEILALKDIGVRPLEYTYATNVGSFTEGTDYTGELVYINPIPLVSSTSFMFAFNEGICIMDDTDDVESNITIVLGSETLFMQYSKKKEAGAELYSPEDDGLSSFILNGVQYIGTGKDVEVYYSGWQKISISPNYEIVVYTCFENELPVITAEGIINLSGGTSVAKAGEYASLEPYVIVP